MYYKIFTRGLILFLAIIFTVSSCKTPPPEEENRTLRIVYTGWSESVAITHLVAVLLEEEMDYSVELKLADVETVYREIAEGKADIFTDAWLPQTHKSYMEQYPDKIVKIGITYPEAKIGFVVPQYSHLKTIADLENYPSPVIGIDQGAGVMQKAKLALTKYAFPNKLISLSEKQMIQQLEDSIKRRREIVITGWEPHWIFARYEVRFLDDPQNLFGVKENIYSVGRTGIQEEHPQAIRFFERMQLTEKQLNQLVYAIQLSDDPRQGAKQWIKENEYIVNQWVKDLKPKRKKIM
ncbi:MAG TPA: glycine betaine ABC transporter substrate-binding protein [Bacteroidales bacterium]|nr:glycine betaine ABC transporter substrate-binding protein [Bacteroidales bacterium]